MAEIQSKLLALGNETAGKVLYPSLMNASLPMYKEVKANAPKDTGRVQANIKRRRLTKSTDGAGVAIYVNTGKSKDRSAFYYIFHEEYGARGRPPIPFIRPAFERGKDDAAQRFNTQVQKRIDKVWNK